MRYHRDSRKIVSSSRKSRWFAPSVYKTTNSVGAVFDRGFYVHMFIEDTGLRIAPIGGKRRGLGEFSAHIENASPELEGRIAAGFPRDSSNDFSGALCDFLRDVMQEVLTYGAAYYEHVRSVDDEGGTIQSLEWIHAPSIKRDWRGRYWQVLPKQFAAEIEAPRKVLLDSDDLFVFRLPQPYSSQRLPVLLQLAKLDELHNPPISAVDGSWGAEFDFRRFTQIQNRAFLRATEFFGWNGRGSVDEFCLEYLCIERLLTYQRFLIRSREEFLREIDRYVKKFPQVSGEPGPVVLHGLPTEADIDRSLELLRSGPKSFRSVVEPYF